MRERIFDIIEVAEDDDRASRFYDVLLMAVAIISVVPMMFKPGELEAGALAFVNMLDIVTAVILIFDYFMRWMTHDLRRERRGKKGGARSFVVYPFTIGAIVDMLAILPTVVPIASSLKFLRLLRLVKIIRKSKNLQIIRNVFVREGRTLVSVFGVVGLFIFVTGMILYLAEPTTFDTFIDALYWSTAALTTIGYGDYHPVSNAGQLVNAFSAIFGIVIMAIPTGIIAAGYVAETQRMRDLGVKSQRVIDADISMADRIAGTVRRVRDARIERRESGRTFRSYVKGSKRAMRYLAVMALCAIFSCATVTTLAAMGVDADVYLLGPAIAAFLLEPAAGIIVGFTAVLVGCIVRANISFILFLGDTCLISIVFGVTLNRHHRLTFKRFALALVLVVFAMLVLQFFEALFTDWSALETKAPILFMTILSHVDPAGTIATDSVEYIGWYLVYYITLSLVVYSLAIAATRGSYALYARIRRSRAGSGADESPLEDAGKVADES